MSGEEDYLITLCSPDGVLCVDEGLGLGAVGVLHPTVRVGDLQSTLPVKCRSKVRRR